MPIMFIPPEIVLNPQYVVRGHGQARPLGYGWKSGLRRPEISSKNSSAIGILAFGTNFAAGHGQTGAY
jgi:hypothetical protein